MNNSLGRVGNPRGAWGVDRLGQMAMAIDHGGRQTMPTGGVGSSIDGRLSGTQEEETMGAWTIRLLYWAPLGVGGMSEPEKDGAPFSCETTAQSTA